ncbi:transcription initiation factor TFIID subunit 15-like [Helianthus annuus]|uniref:transcription initiation factor TFIID subunit 15-like n=1 Tax=Helianthus annuus TaxID=4232 RepID=UPI0016533F04|nr:transcription initiation factor TFIID subunit 15-like [Helianthus annuus]
MILVLEELALRLNIPPKAWQQDRVWICPSTSCTIANFAFRGVCNRFGSVDPPANLVAVQGRLGETGKCNTSKYGVREGGVRGGRTGGYKELDEEELEETKRRMQHIEEDDGELYDEFGNMKKKYRVKAYVVIGHVLSGTGRAG